MLAIRTGVPVVPVAITGTRALLGPGAALAIRPGRAHVAYLAPIPTRGLGATDADRLRDRTEAAVRAAAEDDHVRQTCTTVTAKPAGAEPSRGTLEPE